jgi:hypothetical protein
MVKSATLLYRQVQGEDSNKCRQTVQELVASATSALLASNALSKQGSHQVPAPEQVVGKNASAEEASSRHKGAILITNKLLHAVYPYLGRRPLVW